MSGPQPEGRKFKSCPRYQDKFRWMDLPRGSAILYYVELSNICGSSPFSGGLVIARSLFEMGQKDMEGLRNS